MNAVEIEQAISDLAQRPFEREEFPYAFLEAFGNKATTLKKLRVGASNASDVPEGVLQRTNIHIATCDKGAVTATLTALKASPKTSAAKAKFVLATDGEFLEAEDLTLGETIACAYSEFANHFGFFLPLAGITTVRQIRNNPIDIQATSRLNRLYLELLKENPDWQSEARRHDLNQFMTRLIFCFFAEDTGIFLGEQLFTRTIEQMSDATNTHDVIAEVFRAMDLSWTVRKSANLRPWAEAFPYVNGGLFGSNKDIPRFSRAARSYLLHAGHLDWQKINPDIFGSMIQAIADDEERGDLGMHYTSVPNILKVLNPLFLDDLRARLEECGDNARMLLNLRKRMAKIRVFDPACGSGNFLVIAYKEMREIEAEINRRRKEEDLKSEIPLTNFRGIELRDFPAEIARLALIIAEYQCDVVYRGQKEALAEFLPLDAQNWIVCGNALRLDWLSVCPPTGTGVKLHGDDLFSTPLDQAQIDFENEGGETYICGNPPYRGTKKQNAEQKSDLTLIFDQRTASWKSLDYVSGWLIKAINFGQKTNAVSAFVTTNSICQGQQVAVLWPQIFNSGYEIVFAHTSFKWHNLAHQKAAVTVVIIGLAKKGSMTKTRIFSETDGKTTVALAENINPYLVNYRNIFISPRSTQISKLPEMLSGDKMTDGGNLVLEVPERDNLLRCFPEAKQIIGRLVGGQELIKGILRYALIIPDKLETMARRIPLIVDRLSAVSAMRAASPKAETQELAATPHRFDETRFIKSRKIIVAQLSSENREFYPCDIFEDSVVAMAPSLVVYRSHPWLLSTIVSRLHNAWIAAVCGKLETRYRYSNTLGWNTFPVPPLTEKNKADLTRCAEDILLAREAHFPKTIADLYDPENMPDNLRHAHDRNDEVLERIYIGRRFKNDTERLEKLFEMYTKMTAESEKNNKRKVGLS